MNLDASLKNIVRKLNRNCRDSGPSIRLAVSPFLPDFTWNGISPERLIERFLVRAIASIRPVRSLRLRARRKGRMTDLEEFLLISPSYWLQLSADCVAETGFESAAHEVLRDLGFHCPEWIGVENSEARLGAFHFGASNEPALVLYIQDKRARRSCDFLIPVTEAAAVLSSNRACEEGVRG